LRRYDDRVVDSLRGPQRTSLATPSPELEVMPAHDLPRRARVVVLDPLAGNPIRRTVLPVGLGEEAALITCFRSSSTKIGRPACLQSAHVYPPFSIAFFVTAPDWPSPCSPRRSRSVAAASGRASRPAAGRGRRSAPRRASLRDRGLDRLDRHLDPGQLDDRFGELDARSKAPPAVRCRTPRRRPRPPRQRRR